MAKSKIVERIAPKRGKLPADPKRKRHGPRRWLEEGFLALYDRVQPSDRNHSAGSPSAEPASEPAPRDPAIVWRDAFAKYRARKQAILMESTLAPMAAPDGVGAPTVPGAANWLSLGPLVVMDGQTGGGERQPVAGRIAGLAIGPGGNTVYAASANGGVFISTNGAGIWKPSEEVDLDPNSPASASLICGAIAIDPADPNRLFVGTGEGATQTYFLRRVTGALPAYRGIGVLRTDTGGSTWTVEPSQPDLAGEAFFALAINPLDRESVVGASTAGLYRRAAQPGGQFTWVRVLEGVFSSAVAASANDVARFFCARFPQPDDAVSSEVLSSTDGETWTLAGNNFPTDAGRVSLGVQPGNPNLVYALVATSTNKLHGLYRLDGVGSNWKRVSGLPNVLPSAQGNYDLAIAVDPQQANIVYLGGSFQGGGASIWRCDIQPIDGAYRAFAPVSIGEHAHSDVHVLVHSPDNPNELWCGCDGGVFLNRDPRGTGKFAAQNIGLACLCCNFIAQHPTDPSVIFTGLQDNGTAYKNGSTWHHVQDGDGGYCVINWRDPDQILVFANGRVFRSSTGGKTHETWSSTFGPDWKTMTQPIVGMPMPLNAAAAEPADAQLVAMGVGPKVWISEDFGLTWPTALAFSLTGSPGNVFALAFASRTRLFIGTTAGQVFRADKLAGGWKAERCDVVNGQSLRVTGTITDVAVDWTDPNLKSVYVAFGSVPGDSVARVWRFDGADWQARAGTPPNNLLDVEHNALAFDRELNHLYVAADIGVWRSVDGAETWDLLQNGLPDAPVFDLQIHPQQRLLRAATHGRGVYEIPI